MILADTGFFVALVVSTDRHHGTAVAAASRYSKEGLVTTWPVLTETIHLIQRNAGPEIARRFLASVHAGAVQLFDLDKRHIHRALELMERYQNLPMDLADATLVICAEETGDGRILSTDRRDFGAYRWKRRKPFRNLLNIDR